MLMQTSKIKSNKINEIKTLSSLVISLSISLIVIILK
jgi:hypothetical protein